MGAIAVAAVKSIGYEGAGTLEFLLDPDGEFYFMEMNTRLQVEHPVTEAITGLDLVELQLRVAGGEPLGLEQEDIKFSGHAIEVRLCSEDAGHDFMPQSGRMALWQMPDELRVEHALQSGSEIPPFYDSMIAKLISHGADPRRGAAQADLRARTDRRVRRHHQSGISASPACAIRLSPAGEATTAFIGQHRDELLAPRTRRGGGRRAGGAAALRHQSAMRRHGGSGRSLAATFPLAAADRSRRMASHESEIVRERDGGYVASGEGGEHRFEIDELGRRHDPLPLDGVMEIGKFLRDGDRLYFLHRGVTISGSRPDPGGAGDGRGSRRRRQGARGDERPRRRGAGQAGRARRGRPAGA